MTLNLFLKKTISWLHVFGVLPWCAYEFLWNKLEGWE